MRKKGVSECMVECVKIEYTVYDTVQREVGLRWNHRCRTGEDMLKSPYLFDVFMDDNIGRIREENTNLPIRYNT